jgi:hypothetical protein
MPCHRPAGYRQPFPQAATPFGVGGRHLLTKYQRKESAQIQAAERVFWNIRFVFKAILTGPPAAYSKKL